MATKPFDREAFVASPFFAALTVPAFKGKQRSAIMEESRADLLTTRMAELGRCTSLADVEAWLELVKGDEYRQAISFQTFLGLVAKGCAKSAFMPEAE